MGRSTKKIPEFVYFIEATKGWFDGPYVHPKLGRKNRKFKLKEVTEC